MSRVNNARATLIENGQQDCNILVYLRDGRQGFTESSAARIQATDNGPDHSGSVVVGRLPGIAKRQPPALKQKAQASVFVDSNRRKNKNTIQVYK